MSAQVKKKLTVAIAGLGGRGRNVYAMIISRFGEEMELKAIADTDVDKLKSTAEQYKIKEENCFNSAEEMLEQEKLTDVIFICTQDKQHVKHAVPALKKGYDILMEKPISPILDDCREVLKAAKDYGRKVVVCHTLRYTPYFTKVKEIIDSGVLGELVSIQGIENVTYWHQAHSFVRGNWRNSIETSPMIIQKCCHDMDLVVWMTGKKCKKISSFGGTYLFRPEKAPEGAPKRCTDGCPARDKCPYDAEKIYIHHQKLGIDSGNTKWPCNVLTLEPTVESVRKALQEGPYGRCVYYCDNDVVDHQVLNLEMEDGITVSFTMCAFTGDGSRHTKYMGTLGCMTADNFNNIIEIEIFGQEKQVLDLNVPGEKRQGYLDGDICMVEEFKDLILYGKEDSGKITNLDCSMESHFMVIAAEQSRREGGRCIDMEEIRALD